MEDVSVDKKPDEFCIIEATVVTGFEPVAKAEAEEKLNATVEECRGRIKIRCPIDRVTEVKL